MSNRPFIFPIFCARAKSKFKGDDGKTRYGCYPAGFLETAREILVRGDLEASIWHIPGGVANHYNGNYGGIQLSGYGPNDLRIDIDQKVTPDILFDIRKLSEAQIPGEEYFHRSVYFPGALYPTGKRQSLWPRPEAIIIDRDYSQVDAENRDNPSTWPDDLNELTRQCLRIVKDGCYVGVLDLISPRPGREYIKSYQVPVMMPDGSRPRIFTVWRKK